MTTEITNHVCPYCKEEIKPDAIKCKHCHSELPATTPSHEGECPYCKEEIKADAIKCKHCKSNLTSLGGTDCECQNRSCDEISTILRQHRIGNTSISSGDLKCALEYLDCLDSILARQPGMCEALQTACRVGERALGSGASVFTR
jgi:hypothetical protein